MSEITDRERIKWVMLIRLTPLKTSNVVVSRTCGQSTRYDEES